MDKCNSVSRQPSEQKTRQLRSGPKHHVQSIQISFQANVMEEADVVTDCGIRLCRFVALAEWRWKEGFFFLNLGSVYVGHNGCWPWGRVDTGPWNPIPCMSDTVKASASSFNISQYTPHTRFSSFFTSSHPPVHSLLYLITSSSMPIYSQSPSPITSLLFHHFPPSHFPLICLPIRASLHSSPNIFF